MTVRQVLSDAGCQRVHDHFIPRMTEHDVPVTGTIKIMHRLLAVAARLLALVEPLVLRHHDVHTVRRAIHLNPSRSLASVPLALIHANDLVLVPSGPNPLVMFVRHLLLLSVTDCLKDLFFVAIISVASRSWPDLCSGHRSPASRDRWLFSPPLPCSAHLCLADRLCSFHSFLVVLAILPCRWVCSFHSFLVVLAILPCTWECSSALHVLCVAEHSGVELRPVLSFTAAVTRSVRDEPQHSSCSQSVN